MSLTLVIIIVTVAASFYAWSREDIYEKWMMYPYRIKRNKEYFRFVTSGFIHSGYGHLGFNMISLYYFGSAVEYVMRDVSPIIFILFYLMAIVVSDITTYLKQQNNPGYRSLGASGGVAAIIFSSIIIHPRNSIGFLLLPGIQINGFLFGIMYLAYSYYQSKNSSDNIGHEAHFYGAIFGTLFTLIFFQDYIPNFIEHIKSGNFLNF
jgi:membrane associated rhomboid family serine protease